MNTNFIPESKYAEYFWNDYSRWAKIELFTLWKNECSLRKVNIHCKQGGIITLLEGWVFTLGKVVCFTSLMGVNKHSFTGVSVHFYEVNFICCFYDYFKRIIYFRTFNENRYKHSKTWNKILCVNSFRGSSWLEEFIAWFEIFFSKISIRWRIHYNMKLIPVSDTWVTFTSFVKAIAKRSCLYFSLVATLLAK